MKHTNPILTGSIQISGSVTADRTLSVTSSVADTAVRVRAGSSGSRPSVSTSIETGSLFYNTDTYALEIFTGVSGSEWQVHASASVTEFSGIASADIEYLVVAGGGGSGGSNNNGYASGGGGAGGYLSSSLSLIESGSSITVTVGGGGTAGSGNNIGGDGGDSSIASAGGTSFTTVTSIGGGSGANSSTGDGVDGGSGGGSANPNAQNTGGSGTTGQGNAGGDGTGTGGYGPGAGGGGAGEEGGDTSGNHGSATSNTAGDGGDGKQSSITGTSTYYAGGGGGGTTYGTNSGQAGSGGQGGGGSAALSGGQGTPGTVNTGGGAGGRSTVANQGNVNGNAGGSGVAIFAYDSGSIHGAGGLSGDAGNGRRYHQFNESGTFKVGSPDNFNIYTTNLTIHLDAGDYESRGTSTWSDLSGNGWDSTLVSSPTLDQNFYYDFDGSADYGTFTSLGHAALSGQSQGTIECWVNGDSFTSGTGRKTIFGTGHSSQTDRWCVFRIHETSNIQWSVNADGTQYGCNTDTLPSTSTWYHLCLTFDGTTAKIYQNGVSQTLTVASNGMRWFNAVSSDTLQVGAMDRGSNGNNYDPFDGKIAQLRVYTSALTEAQVLQNYEATKTNFE